jgi:predicted metallo-beta-lactamase superfamily hydrolase
MATLVTITRQQQFHQAQALHVNVPVTMTTVPTTDNNSSPKTDFVSKTNARIHFIKNPSGFYGAYSIVDDVKECSLSSLEVLVSFVQARYRLSGKLGLVTFL